MRVETRDEDAKFHFGPRTRAHARTASPPRGVTRARRRDGGVLHFGRRDGDDATSQSSALGARVCVDQHSDRHAPGSKPGAQFAFKDSMIH